MESGAGDGQRRQLRSAREESATSDSREMSIHSLVKAATRRTERLGRWYVENLLSPLTY